jgi:hypothetical protein
MHYTGGLDFSMRIVTNRLLRVALVYALLLAAGVVMAQEAAPKTVRGQAIIYDAGGASAKRRLQLGGPLCALREEDVLPR